VMGSRASLTETLVGHDDIKLVSATRIEGLSPGKVIVEQTTGDLEMTFCVGEESRRFGVNMHDDPGRRQS